LVPYFDRPEDIDASELGGPKRRSPESEQKKRDEEAAADAKEAQEWETLKNQPFWKLAEHLVLHNKLNFLEDKFPSAINKKLSDIEPTATKIAHVAELD
jgi:hypothetical protein